MATLSESSIADLLAPYLLQQTQLPADLYSRLSLYLELLLKWNARTNLTAIRDPEEIVRRHFGESLFAAQHLGACDTLLDFGSGAGFPGLPTAILLPGISVTLAESQNKKAAFLREVIRTLEVRTEVWPARVDTMPESRLFHTVTLRAVDNMAAALVSAQPRAVHQLLLLTTSSAALPPISPAFVADIPIPLPGSTTQILFLARRDPSKDVLPDESTARGAVTS